MHIEVFPCGPLATNAYLLVDDSGRAAIIDPAPGSLPQLIECVNANQWVVEKILLTHSHWDHIADCDKVKKHFEVPVYVHGEDAGNLRRPGSDRVPMIPFPIKGVEPDVLLEEGQQLQVGSLQLEVMHTPGHCPGLVCFYCSDESFLICGDLFFRGSMGTLAVPTAEPERMWISLERVSKLPPETRVYPGHGRPTTIGEEEWLSKARKVFE